jgi:hypothetical protein
MNDEQMQNFEPNSKPNIERLVSALVDETIGDDERRQLVELLRADPAARRTYLDMLSLDSLLQWDYAEASLGAAADLPPVAGHTPTAAVAAPERQMAVMRWSLAAAVLLCVTLAALLGAQLAESRAVAETADRKSEGGPVAIITDLKNATWTAGAPTPEPYRPLVPGWLKLDAGRASLDFFAGARAVLEGPAELGINAANRAVLRSGRLSVVTGRHGASFHAATSILVASGRSAEFGLFVPNDETVELHIFSGAVEASLAGDAGETVVLEAGEALIAARDGDEVRHRLVPAARARFATVGDENLAKPLGPVRSIDFGAQPVLPYGYQDGQYDLPTHHEVLDGGRTLHLVGNAWKMIEVNAELTRDTVVEFEFRSPREGQIHGFGFDNDDNYKSSDLPIFQVYGYEARQDIGQQFNDYSGSEWRRYRVRVGRYAAGPQRYLYFAADEDVTGEAESFFRNVRIYQAGESQSR